MVASIERGIYMETNRSWSIDDSRNKFQFGCERGRLIENGKLGKVVKNPNYRGVSASFWRSLRKVGNATTLQGARHALLRQGRAGADHSRGSRVAGVRVRRCCRVRRGAMMATTLAAGTVADAGMESYFHSLADGLDRAIRAGEQYTAWLDAEVTDFVRMNRGKVRQPGSVSQRYLSVRLIAGARHAEHTLSLTGDAAEDACSVADALASLRAALPELAEDPHLLLPTDVVSSRDERGGGLPPSELVIDGILDAAQGLDLVGLYAAGPVYRGFANSQGQRNWHAATTFNLQWSLYHRADKAVKSAYAGFTWDDATFGAKMAQAREQLAMLAQPAKVLAPGRYRAFLTPAAMEEISGLLRWSAFSGRALATRQSPLVRMESGERFDPRVGIAEDLAAGVAPRFQGEGFARPARVPLIENGALVGSLVSPRTAREFGLATNGANGQESPESLVMAGATCGPTTRSRRSIPDC